MAKKYVLTKPEAFSVMRALHDVGYFYETQFDGDKHATETIIDEARRSGHEDLASTLRDAHNALLGAKEGKFIELAFFYEDSSIADRITEEAQNTKFENSVKGIVRTIRTIEKNFHAMTGIVVDLEKSNKLLAKVKHDHFPKALSMIERLNHWQEKQSKSKRSPSR
ncbi:MAG: hypothetical protein KGJ06_03460 [Pseudomonadota bacterium]|nr:hypothetical protein [Pseudomonadota bacterium]